MMCQVESKFSQIIKLPMLRKLLTQDKDYSHREAERDNGFS